MRLLLQIKRVRLAYWYLIDLLFAVAEIAKGLIVAPITGRFAPAIVREEAALDALIVCPSPLLNMQPINRELRSRYVISFVNSAAVSPMYEKLRPERFFIIDPAFFNAWTGPAKESDGAKEVEKTLISILNKTSWPMTVIIPWHYRNSSQAKRLRQNKNIKVVGIPILSARGTVGGLRRLAFRLGILNPVYQNVLIAATFYALRAGHRRVLLWGAHHTWLKDVEVGADNRVMHSVRHTETQHTGRPLLNPDGTSRPYHVYLRQLSIAFEQYHVIEDYARSTGQEVINVTSESFIDAFERGGEVDLFAARSDA